ncbi:MAG: hypothetical protein IPJ84_20535 [Bdellovibrionales bacterium]|nr:hypothetical protein [Bdellovibrionales bacterium]
MTHRFSILNIAVAFAIGISAIAHGHDAERTSCKNVYQKPVRTESNGLRQLTVAVLFGYRNSEVNPFDTGPEGREYFEARLQRPCKTIDPTQFCGFTPSGRESHEFVKAATVQGETLPLFIRLYSVNPTMGQQTSVNPRDPRNVRLAEEWIEQLKRSTQQDSATLVISHSRGGAGPDLLSQRGYLELVWNSYFGDNLSFITSALSPAGTGQILGLLSCQSERYFHKALKKRIRQSGKAADEVSLILSSVDTYPSDNVLVVESVVGGLGQGLCPREIQHLFKGGDGEYSPRDSFNFHWAAEMR